MLVIVLSLLCIKFYFFGTNRQKGIGIGKNNGMKITSSGFASQQKIPSKYTCSGQNNNPPLTFSEIPVGTRSLVLIMDDPDAPMGTWVHWVIYNMEPTIKGIKEKSKPSSGNEGVTSFGKQEYGGPCPPSGTHRYFFKLYALDTKLDFSLTPDKNTVEGKMQGHLIEQTELVGLYTKQ